MSNTPASSELPVDPELDSLLIERGWTIDWREPQCDVYDWLPSAADETDEVTYLIVEGRGPDRPLGSPYRLRLVDGEHLEYATAEDLVADLDAIEAYRFQRGTANQLRAISVFTHTIRGTQTD